MISTVLCGRFYKIFVSPMLHKKEDSKLLSFFCAASCSHPRASRWLLDWGKITIFVLTNTTSDKWRRRKISGKPVAWGLYEALKKELVWRYPEMEVRVAKTQLSFFDRLMFGCVSFTRVRRKAEMPAHFLTLTLGLPEPVDSPRIAVKCEPYPGRWTHHIVLASPDEIDSELLAWIDRAHQFAQR